MTRALIVDDSKTAQIRLKKMLSRFPLAVDIAHSAEEALGYLTYESPSVIFLDHHMEGMDGFEALKIIKANPNTAMIPVIMYTAQKGDVYVGQARALGAIDILSKEILKPSNLERVLTMLGIVPTDTDTDTLTPPPNDAPEKAINTAGVAERLERLLDAQLADIRQEISDNARTTVNYINEHINHACNREPTVGDIPLSVVNAEYSADQKKASVISSSLLVLIFIGLAILAIGLFQTKQDLKTAHANYIQLVELNRQEHSLAKSIPEKIIAKSVKADTINTNALIDVIAWALETDMQFDYNTAPLSENQVIKISNLIYRLATSGYIGTVELTIHFGNVCLEQDDDTGEWALAKEAIPADQCTLQQDVNTEFYAGDYLSVPYLNFEQTATPLKNGKIEMHVTSDGLTLPRHEYPLSRTGLTAGEWNRIALKNNRVSVNFLGL